MKKTEQYTFGAEEKEILEILATFERNLKEKLSESKSEIERIKYYEKFQISGIDFDTVFVTAEKDIDGNISYHVYSGEDASNELITINHKGKLTVTSALRGYIDELDMEETMTENEKQKGRLKGISEKAEPEEIEEHLKTKENKNNKDTDVEEVDEDLEENGESLQISYYREIKDKNFEEQMRKDFSGCEEYGMAYSKAKNAFVLVVKKDGKFEQAEGFKPSQRILRKVISINKNGEEVEKKVPYAIMETNDSRRELSITIGQYGYIEVGTIERLPSNVRIEEHVREDGETGELEDGGQQLSKDYMRAKREKGIDNLRNMAKENEEEFDDMEIGEKKEDNVKDEIRYGNDDVNEANIEEKDFIPNTQKTWKELMEETGESLTKLVERYNREMSKEGAESEEAVSAIEADYENISREHKRN